MGNEKTRISFYGRLRYGGLTPAEFERIAPDMFRRNHVTLCLASALGAGMMLCLVLATCFLPSLRDMRSAYVFFCAVFALICLLANLVRRRGMTTALLYLLLSAAFAFGIYIGTVMNPGVTATTFDVLIFALPLLLVDQPTRCSLLVTAATVCFCVCAVIYKDPVCAERDLINTISFYVLSIAVNHHVMKTKLRELLSQSSVAQERDTDHLTGLLNSAAGRKAIENYLTDDPAPAAFLILDIDHFKDCNDTYGHAYGDTVLHLMGESMRRVGREEDILVRMGGDEFLLLLPGLTRQEQVADYLQRLYDAVRGSESTDTRLAALTVSVGSAVFPTDSMSYNTLYHMADKALYAAKAAGRDRLQWYSALSRADMF